MKTQEILTRVNAILAFSPDSDAAPIPGTMRGELASLAADLEAQLRAEVAASNGDGNATRTITAMLNYAKKHDFRESLHYAWLDSKGRQCACDGYRAFRLNDPLPLEPRPESAGEAIDLDKIFPKAMKGYAAAPLPSLKEIKAFIAVERAKYTGKRGKFLALWDFGEGKPVVNAEYLRDLVAVFPDATEIFHGTGTNLYAPLIVHCERGDAILMPTMTARVKAEIAAAKQKQADAERAIRRQAGAEGRDPEYIREREERKAKNKAEAEKELTDHVAWIRSEMARQENYSMEPDEFEYLLHLMDHVAA